MVKKLLGLELPLIAGREGIIFLEDGSKAQTFIKKIHEAKYSNGVLYVTFSSVHSLYMAEIDVIERPLRPIEKQLIREGEEVSSKEGGKELIESIIEITESGIGVRTKTGIFCGKVKLAEKMPE